MNKRKPLVFLLIVSLLISALPAVTAEGDTAVYNEKTYPKSAEYIDLGDTVVNDFNQFMVFLDQMPELTRVDMWETRMTAENCDLLSTRYPRIRWGWTMVLKGTDHEHLIRTDYTSWSTLHNNKSTHHYSEDFSILKYCWDLKALDIGHNSVTDLGFLKDLPDLRVLIVACNEITDISPLASLERLEYAELFKNKITDLSPLAGMEHLLDLNICFNHVDSYEPLKNLKTLQRLWIFSSQSYNKKPASADIKALKEALPDTFIDSSHYSTTGGWRTNSAGQNHPHYQAIIDMFGADHLHPRYEYVPFAESVSYDPAPAAADSAPATPVPAAEEAEPSSEPAPAKSAPASFLLPFDFNPGSEPSPDKFTETHYADSTIEVTIATDVFESCQYWTADIQLTDVSQLRTMAASADGSFGKGGQLTVSTFAARSKAVLAINGDYYSSSERNGYGYLLRQGTLFRSKLDEVGRTKSRLMDILLIDENGDFHVLHRPDQAALDEALQQIGYRIINAFSFGPILVENGQAVYDYQGAEKWMNMAFDWPRQRICLCQTGPLHYKVICCAGRYRTSTGLTLEGFTRLVESQNVQVAYNLDGGDSTWMCFNGKKVNECGATSQRKLNDIIYFASAE